MPRFGCATSMMATPASAAFTSATDAKLVSAQVRNSHGASAFAGSVLAASA